MFSMAALQGGDRLGAGLLLDDLEGGVDDLLGGGALAVEEHLVDDLGDEQRPVDRVGHELAARGGTLAAGIRRAAACDGARYAPSFGAVAAAGLLAVLDAGGVEGAADDLVANAGEVLHPTAAHEHDRVLLEVVALARDVGGDLLAARQAHAGDLAEGGVRLLGGVGEHAGAHTAPLRRALQSGRLGLCRLGLPALADQLLDGGHSNLACDEDLRTSGGTTGPQGAPVPRDNSTGPPARTANRVWRLGMSRCGDGGAQVVS